MSAETVRVSLDTADADLAAAVAVMHRAFAQFSATGVPSGALVETADTLRTEVGAGERVATVRHGDRIVAMVKHHDTEDGHRYFGRLAVDPDARGLGAARALVEALRDDAYAAGRRGLACLVRENEPGNVALYEHLGLVVTGRGERISRTGAVIAVVEMADPPDRAV